MVEILVWDDGSEKKYNNEAVAGRLPRVRYLGSETNRGRAASRNALLEQAGGDYLLFLDADMLPDREDFIRRYLEQAEAGQDVVCGGISYRRRDDIEPRHSFYLYKSERCEALPAVTRNRAPWRYLFTSNVMIRRTIVDSIPFDSRFTGYGFEDVEWGLRLSGLYTLKHIDNTCSHLGVMAKEEVLAKMRASIINFALLLSLHPEVKRVGAPRLAAGLRILPGTLLGLLDTVLVRSFRFFSWNPLLFILFQADKAVLLARELQNKDAR